MGFTLRMRTAQNSSQSICRRELFCTRDTGRMQLCFARLLLCMKERFCFCYFLLPFIMSDDDYDFNLGLMPSTPQRDEHSDAGASSWGRGLAPNSVPGGVRAIFLSSLDANTKCFGLISTGNTFCLKERETLEDRTIGETCGVGKHLTKFEPDLSAYFIPGTSTSAYTNPSVRADQVTEEERQVLEKGVKTGGGWRTYFRVCQAQTSAQRQSSNPFQPGVMFVKTPAKG